MEVSPIREPLIRGSKNYSQVTSDILAPMAGKPSKYWYMGITLAGTAALFGAWATYMTVFYGIGTWNLNDPSYRRSFYCSGKNGEPASTGRQKP